MIEPERLTATAASVLVDNDSALYLSPISVWETLVLARKGRLALEPDPESWVRDALAAPVRMAPLTYEIAIRSEALPGYPDPDPVDRFLIATSLEDGLCLITADRRIRDYEPVDTLW